MLPKPSAGANNCLGARARSLHRRGGVQLDSVLEDGLRSLGKRAFEAWGLGEGSREQNRQAQKSGSVLSVFSHGVVYGVSGNPISP